MSNENYNEEIDLMQIFAMIKNGFRKFLKLIVSVILFYKKKAILFLILLIVGLGIGYFIDQNQDTKDVYVQEVIIEPKYNSTEYIYDFIDGLEDNFEDSLFVKKLGLEIDLVENIKEISFVPIIRAEDVLSELHEEYQDKGSFIEVYDEKLLDEKKYRNFYKQHKLIVRFKSIDNNNKKVVKNILGYIKSNDYFKEVLDLELKQATIALAQNKESLRFINEYLTNLTKKPIQNDSKFVFAVESESPTIPSLLKQKEELIEIIKEEEKLLALDKEVFSVVDYGDIISNRKMLLGRTLLIIPLILFGAVSLFFFLKYLSRTINNFIREEE
ncbi:hypothetical protein [Aquimarina aquimarini]|uniref:hypothetical protein n=1 Tax=Aquimarina aquimarini TaxID=1191734 RepID=UPI000D561755|nr:hypothetical protein [Aquimarina aquimarini]